MSHPFDKFDELDEIDVVCMLSLLDLLVSELDIAILQLQHAFDELIQEEHQQTAPFPLSYYCCCPFSLPSMIAA